MITEKSNQLQVIVITDYDYPNSGVQNAIFNDKSAILLHPVIGIPETKLCAKDAGCAGNKITGRLIMK